MKKKKNLVPRAALKCLVDDINSMIGSQEKKLHILEAIEEIPFENRNQVFEALSSFYTPQMLGFFRLILAEYGKEMEALVSRTIEKYSLAGMDVSPPAPFTGRFYKAYASCSRHTGRITLDVAWQVKKQNLQVECFYLTFNPDGIHSFFLLENMPIRQYENDRQLLPDMVELNFEESCFLVAQAYAFNIKNMTRPALGRFLYQKYLDYPVQLNDHEVSALTSRLSLKMNPAQVINSFFHALKYQDFDYIKALAMEPGLSEILLERNFSELLRPGAGLLEGQIDQVHGSKNSVWVQAFATMVIESEFYRNNYSINLQRSGSGQWYISDIRFIQGELLNSAADSPQMEKIPCRVYDILDLDRLFEILDRIDNIYEVEELPCGMHMRINCLDDSLNQGVSFLTGVVADLVINGEELVLFSQKGSTLKDFELILGQTPDSPIKMKLECSVGLLTAYNFLRGRYLSFYDAFEAGEREPGIDDGMRFISTRYIIKDQNAVRVRIEEMQDFGVELPGDIRIHYHLEDNEEGSDYFAEFMVGSNWLTLSTFGDREMGLARRRLEDQMFDYLEIDGMEIREEGVFDILTSEVKREYPYLEGVLKEVYLDKWSKSRLSTLSGMTPSEASETEEGNRLLWSMLKKMTGKNNNRYQQGKKRYIQLHEYIHKLQQKKPSQQ